MGQPRRSRIRVFASSRRPRSEDSANLMLLSGILITTAFIVTALTLAQVSSLERQAAAETPAIMSSEWRFMHERVPANVNSSMGAETGNATFFNVTFPAIAETFRSVEAGKGYDIAIRLAGSTLPPAIIVESDLLDTSGFNYAAYSIDGKVHYSQPYDGVSDGLIWGACHDGRTGGCAIGVLVHVHLTDGASTVEETILVPTNQE